MPGRPSAEVSNTAISLLPKSQNYDAVPRPGDFAVAALRTRRITTTDANQLKARDAWVSFLEKKAQTSY